MPAARVSLERAVQRNRQPQGGGGLRNEGGDISWRWGWHFN